MTCRISKLSAIAGLVGLALGACTIPLGSPGPVPSAATIQATTRPASTSSTAATPAPADWIRPSAIAGTWYPADRDALGQQVDALLAPVEPVDGAPIGIIVPHAGYTFSGPVAAAGFKQLQAGQYDVAVIIAADHQEPLSHPISVWAEGAFETPLGRVPVDTGVAQALMAADPRIKFDAAAHAGEHPIEIELPFLQRVCPGCRIVPILMGTDDDETVQALADALLRVLPGRRAVVIASSDLSHYPAYKDAQTVDGATLDAIETGDAVAVRAAIAKSMAAGVPHLATCACGEAPILVMLRVAQGLGADTVTVLRYANSGDVPQGDKDQVVGYGAVMLWRYEPPLLTAQQRQELLTLARTAIAEQLKTGKIPEATPQDPGLARRSAAFVTLKQRGELRGCIGHIWADKPLYRVVEEMAVAAAVSDPRFPSLKAEDLGQVEIEISVLSPMRRVTDPEQIQVGRDGLWIAKSGHQGLLLPQVAVDAGLNRQQFLDGVCEKAGLWKDCWREGAALHLFTALVFGEGRP
jgi:MEMO1 family protein